MFDANPVILNIRHDPPGFDSANTGRSLTAILISWPGANILLTYTFAYSKQISGWTFEIKSGHSGRLPLPQLLFKRNVIHGNGVFVFQNGTRLPSIFGCFVVYSKCGATMQVQWGCLRNTLLISLPMEIWVVANAWGPLNFWLFD
jgi:hypothetical protein